MFAKVILSGFSPLTFLFIVRLFYNKYWFKHLATSTPQIQTPTHTHKHSNLWYAYTNPTNTHIKHTNTHTSSGGRNSWVQMWPGLRHTENVPVDRMCRPQAISGSTPVGRRRHSANSGTRKWHSYSSKPSSKHLTWVSGDRPPYEMWALGGTAQLHKPVSRRGGVGWGVEASSP